VPASYQVKLPVPSDWQELQRMTSALYKRIWKNEDIQEFGSLGQRQHGVDIFGSMYGRKKLGGVQCKCVSSFSTTELETEYREALKFTPKLSKFVIVTTTKRDTALQRKSVALSQEGPLRCTIMFWQEFCDRLSEEKDLLRKFFAEFILFGAEGDCAGKLMKVDIDVTHFELVVSKIKATDKHYGGVILVSDLQRQRCITYRLGDHWSRLEGVVGVTRCDAFVVSKWLNSFKKIEKLLQMGTTSMSYELSSKDRREAKECGFALIKN
jgi:hypothetical protein